MTSFIVFLLYVSVITVSVSAPLLYYWKAARKLVFYTKNRGRTFWYNGKELRASKLTDQLQLAYSKQNMTHNSAVGWKDSDFYNDND